MTTVRQPAVAGQFYAGTATELVQQLDGVFEHEHGPDEVPEHSGSRPSIHGLVSPHAGYPYSGPVAAHGFAALAADGTPDAVVVIGPNHTGLGEALAVSSADRWNTPLGDVPIHGELRDRVLAGNEMVVEDEQAHAGEHSIEVQIPFLQYLYDDPIPILPVCMTRQDEPTAMALADALSGAIDQSNESVVVVASTDMTHYQPQTVAERQDRKAIDRIEALDAPGLLETVTTENLSMCGYGPTAAMLEVAGERGAETGELLHYATSGDTGGPSREVVGYASLAIR